MKAFLAQLKKIFSIALGESIFGLLVLFLLPGEGAGGFSLQRVVLIGFLAVTGLLSLVGNYRLKENHAQVFKRVLSRPNSDLVLLVVFVLIVATFLSCVVLLATDSSRLPLLIRISLPLLPWATFSAMVLQLQFSQLAPKQRIKLLHRAWNFLLISVAVIGISGMVVYFQIRWQGTEWLQTSAVETHNLVMGGQAGEPRQYRILPEILVEATRSILDLGSVQDSLIVALVTWRFLSNVAMLSAALLFYRVLGLTTFSRVFAIGVIGLTLTDAINGSNLAINTYLDVSFYLLAGCAILSRSPKWLLPITALAALNRETSGLIPFMLLAHYYVEPKAYSSRRQAVTLFLWCIFLFAGIFIGQRLLSPSQGVLIPYGVQFGFDLLSFNLSKSATWIQLFATFGILPFMAMFAYRRLPAFLRALMVLIVPFWYILHFFVGVIAESRLLLVPYALIFVPGVLLVVQSNKSAPRS